MATKTATGGLSRITIVAPRTRMDLALPSDVPLADLLPTLLRYAGEDLADEGVRHGGWSLSRLGGAAAGRWSYRRAARRPRRRGALLQPARRRRPGDRLRRRGGRGRHRHQPAARHLAGRHHPVLRGALRRRRRCRAGALAALLAGPPQLPGALAALVVAVALLVGAAVLSRAAGDSRTGAVLAMGGLGYAAVGGLLVLAGDRKLAELASPHVLLAATAVVVFGAIAALAVGDRLPLFFGAIAVGAAVGLGAVLCLAFGIGAAAAAAVVATVAFAALPAPADDRLPAGPAAGAVDPHRPGGPEDRHRDRGRPAGAAQQRTRRPVPHRPAVDRVAAGARRRRSSWPATGGCRRCCSAWCWRCCRCCGRGRSLGRAQRTPVLLRRHRRPRAWPPRPPSPPARWRSGSGLILGGLLLAAVISLIYGLTVAGKRISPVWGRTPRHRRDPADRRAGAARRLGLRPLRLDRQPPPTVTGAHRGGETLPTRRGGVDAGTVLAVQRAGRHAAARRPRPGPPSPAPRRGRPSPPPAAAARHPAGRRAAPPRPPCATGRRSRSTASTSAPSEPSAGPAGPGSAGSSRRRAGSVQVSAGASGARSSPAAETTAARSSSRPRTRWARPAAFSALPSRPIPAATVRCTPRIPPPRLTASARASPDGQPQRHPDGPVRRRRRARRRVPDQGVRDDLGPGDRGGEVGEHRQRPVHHGRLDRAGRRTGRGRSARPRRTSPGRPGRCRAGCPARSARSTVSSGASAASRGSPAAGTAARARSRRRRSRRRSSRSSYHQRPPRRAKAAATTAAPRDHADGGSSQPGRRWRPRRRARRNSSTTSCPTTHRAEPAAAAPVGRGDRPVRRQRRRVRWPYDRVAPGPASSVSVPSGRPGISPDRSGAGDGRWSR